MDDEEAEDEGDTNEEADSEEDKDKGDFLAEDDGEVTMEAEREEEEEEEGSGANVDEEADVVDKVSGEVESAWWLLCSCRSTCNRSCSPATGEVVLRGCGGDGSSCSGRGGKGGRDSGGNFMEFGRGIAGDDSDRREARGERDSGKSR